MDFFKMTGKEKVTNPSNKNNINTDEVFMIMPLNDELYLKFSEENGRKKMNICDSKSHLDVTYPLTGNPDLYPNIKNISLINQLIETRKQLY